MTQFYFVCPSCDAKFFKSYSSAICVRCGQHLHSTEKLTPPWEARRDTAQRRAEIYLLSKGLQPLREPLLLRALSQYFLKPEDGHEAAAAP
ncbi:MAG TPA: hypothetical protein VFI31_00575 [Pirellulales bacterium]|nr:hypothetical protein [Pirellulales bacterium]